MQKGWTLLELLTVVAVLGVVTVLAVPAFNRMAARNRLVTGANAIIGAMRAARTASVETGQPVAFCAGDPDAGCSGDWSDHQWLVFVDEDHDGQLDDSETALQSGVIHDEGLVISGNGPFDSAVVFMPIGTSQRASGAFAAGTLRLCELAQISPNASDLVLASTGRVRISHQDLGGTCPPI